MTQDLYLLTNRSKIKALNLQWGDINMDFNYTNTEQRDRRLRANRAMSEKDLKGLLSVLREIIKYER